MSTDNKKEEKGNSKNKGLSVNPVSQNERGGNKKFKEATPKLLRMILNGLKSDKRQDN